MADDIISSLARSIQADDQLWLKTQAEFYLDATKFLLRDTAAGPMEVAKEVLQAHRNGEQSADWPKASMEDPEFCGWFIRYVVETEEMLCTQRD